MTSKSPLPPLSPPRERADDMPEPQNSEQSPQPHENGAKMDPEFTPPPIQAETQKRIAVFRQQKERRARLAGLVLRCAGVVFSFLSFVIIACNNHYKLSISNSDYYDVYETGLTFSDFEEYSYFLAIAVIAFVYLAMQLCRGIYDILYGHDSPPNIVLSYIDFICDQLLSYLIMSSSSSAATITNRLRDAGNTKFTDMAAASVSMSFVAFASLAASSILSGFALSKRVFWA